MDWKHIPSLLYETAREWHNDNASMYAAALAYFTIFSIAPMFIFVVSIASIIFSRQNARLWLFRNTEPFVGQELMNALRSILENIQDTPTTLIATILGLATFFLGTTRIVSHLQNSFNNIWDIPPRPGGGVWGTVKGRLSGFLIVLATGVFLVILAVASAFISTAGAYLDQMLPSFGSILQVSDFLVSMIIGTLVFSIMFKFFPDAKIAWSDVWIGSLVTAFLFFVGKQLLGIYLSQGAVRSAYGAAGSLVVIILWIYYTAQITFFGAEFTQVYAGRYGTKIKRERKPRREHRREHPGSHEE